MPGKSSIEWTEKTWNPIVGCSHVSDGCKFCYAEKTDHRIRGVAGELWKPWTANNATYNVRTMRERFELPLQWKTPALIFVNSMSDLYHDLVSRDDRAELWAIMAGAQQHLFQVLTKREDLLAEETNDRTFWELVSEKFWARWKSRGGGPVSDRIAHWPPPNVWVGVSAETQKDLDRRTPKLLAATVAVRFLSLEPCLEALDLRPWLGMRCGSCQGDGRKVGWIELGRSYDNGHFEGDPSGGPCGPMEARGAPGVDWVIMGGESGTKALARPFDIEWMRSARDQCSMAGVPFFAKQLGRNPFDETTFRPFKFFYELDQAKGDDPSEWPADLQGCRAMPARDLGALRG